MSNMNMDKCVKMLANVVFKHVAHINFDRIRIAKKKCKNDITVQYTVYAVIQSI